MGGLAKAQSTAYLESMAMLETLRTCCKRIEDFAVQQDSRERDKSTSQRFTDGLDIRTGYLLLLPGMDGSCLAHTAHDLFHAILLALSHYD